MIVAWVPRLGLRKNVPLFLFSHFFCHTSLQGRPRPVLLCLVVLKYDARWYATSGLLQTTWYDYCSGATSLCSITSFISPRYEVDLIPVLPCLVVLKYDARWYATSGLLQTTWYDYCSGATSLCPITRHTSLWGRPRPVLPCLVVLRYDARWYATNGLLQTTWYEYCSGATSLCPITRHTSLWSRPSFSSPLPGCAEIRC